jgi:hypothetical protein
MRCGLRRTQSGSFRRSASVRPTVLLRPTVTPPLLLPRETLRDSESRRYCTLRLMARSIGGEENEKAEEEEDASSGVEGEEASSTLAALASLAEPLVLLAFEAFVFGVDVSVLAFFLPAQHIAAEWNGRDGTRAAQLGCKARRTRVPNIGADALNSELPNKTTSGRFGVSRALVRQIHQNPLQQHVRHAKDFLSETMTCAKKLRFVPLRIPAPFAIRAPSGRRCLLVSCRSQRRIVRCRSIFSFTRSSFLWRT